MRPMTSDALSARLLRVAPDGVPLNVTWAPTSRTLHLTGMVVSPAPHVRFRRCFLWLLPEASTAFFARRWFSSHVAYAIKRGIDSNAEGSQHVVLFAVRVACRPC